MEEENPEEYREHPRTGTTPEGDDFANRPQAVDPSVLTDDRGDADLLVFERTWGHRLLAGIGIAMIVIACVLVLYCLIKMANVSVLSGVADELVSLGYMLYGLALVAGLALVPPAIVAIYVAKHPHHAMLAIVMAIIAFVLLAVFVGLAIAVGTNAISLFVYTLLAAILPAIYLVAALKIRRSSR